MIRDINGRQNHSVKLARKLQKKKHRIERGLLVGEGMDLLRAALEAGADMRDVLVRRDLVSELPPNLIERARSTALAGPADVSIGVCDDETLAYASSLGGSADVIFVCVEPPWNLGDLELRGRVTLFLDGVGDPGNVGSLVRSGVAFGAAGVVCSPGTADPFGPTALRAGMGAQFSLPIVTEVRPQDLNARLDRLKVGGGSGPLVVVADPYQGDHAEALGRRMRNASEGLILVLGAERRGPAQDWADERRVSIPQVRFDSLNVAMAGTVLLYELSKNRGVISRTSDK